MVEVGQVHRPAAAAVEPGRAAHQLGGDGGRVGTARQHMPVPTVGRGHHVVRSQRAGDAHGDRLVPVAEVCGAVHLARLEPALHLFLEAADERHLLEEREQSVDVDRRLTFAHVTSLPSSSVAWIVRSVAARFDTTARHRLPLTAACPSSRPTRPPRSTSTLASPSRASGRPRVDAHVAGADRRRHRDRRDARHAAARHPSLHRPRADRPRRLPRLHRLQAVAGLRRGAEIGLAPAGRQHASQHRHPDRGARGGRSRRVGRLYLQLHPRLLRQVGPTRREPCRPPPRPPRRCRDSLDLGPPRVLAAPDDVADHASTIGRAFYVAARTRQHTATIKPRRHRRLQDRGSRRRGRRRCRCCRA